MVPLSKASTWILGIAHNKALQALSRDKRSGAMAIDPPGGVDHSQGPDVALREMETVLDAALKLEDPMLLAQAHRALVLLNIWTGQGDRVRVHADQALDLARSAMKNRPMAGHISFQDEAKVVSYRSIRIKELR